ncbi:lysophospholipid acyltransferase family protein [Qingshengfaniella alkalisoli]|uniref:lysophospholipid acyltransferase family protein n=1 Tax=Qingshengfaniella alkalisoli TaxID=2599296 RepID=UPI00143D5235|nr:lysophospholipid acyltransferase family protein [Qingshengfaniella alkalisoli]
MKRLKKRWRQFEVRIQRNKRVQAALKGCYARYLEFVYRTTKWEKIGFESYEADIARGTPRVLCCWHSRLAMTPYLRDWDDHRLTVMASEHADAQIAVASVEARGIDVILIATSGDKSGPLKAAIRALSKGSSLGITVDGPFGPREEAKSGALVIAGMAGVQAAPCSFAVKRCIRLKTWDRFVVPLPFSKGVLAVGDGFTPPKTMTHDEMREARKRLTGLIADLTRTCDDRVAE